MPSRDASRSMIFKVTRCFCDFRQHNTIYFITSLGVLESADTTNIMQERLEIPKGYSGAIHHRTDNTMTKRKGQKEQQGSTKHYKKNKLKTEQHESHKNLRVNSCVTLVKNHVVSPEGRDLYYDKNCCDVHQGFVSSLYTIRATNTAWYSVHLDAQSLTCVWVSIEW